MSQQRDILQPGDPCLTVARSLFIQSADYRCLTIKQNDAGLGILGNDCRVSLNLVGEVQLVLVGVDYQLQRLFIDNMRGNLQAKDRLLKRYFHFTILDGLEGNFLSAFDDCLLVVQGGDRRIRQNVEFAVSLQCGQLNREYILADCFGNIS